MRVAGAAPGERRDPDGGCSDPDAPGGAKVGRAPVEGLDGIGSSVVGDRTLGRDSWRSWKADMKRTATGQGSARASQANDAGGLSIYGYPQCPFCGRVLRAIASLGLEIPLRNTRRESEHRDRVVEATGRGMVPVLRIDHEDGQTEWLPESAEIVRYLTDRFGHEESSSSRGGS